jgi:hypothetical protein
MKFDVRKAILASALAFAVIVFGSPKLFGAYPGQDQNQTGGSTNNSLYQQGLSNGQEDRANNRPHQYRMHPDNDADRHAYESGYDQGFQNQNSDNANNSLYQQGLSNGQEDGANNRSHQYRLHPDNDADRRAYESGYDQGFQNNSRSGTNRGQDRDANGNYNGQNGQYGQYGPDGNVAAQNGFQDGANDGLQDRQAGQSSRATKHDSWKHGDRGYNSSFGSKDQYKVSYRQGYTRGYQQGYNGQSFQNNNGQYGQYGPNGNVAAQNGFQDGANDGLQDRQAGHSSRATKHESWEHGDRGYNSSFGSKDQYKALYRQAYIQGYQQGYNSQGSDNRR